MSAFPAAGRGQTVHRPLPRLAVLAIGIAVGWSGTPGWAADAQPPVPPVDAGRPGYLPPRPEGLFPLPPVVVPEPPNVAGEAATGVLLKRVRLNGNTAIPNDDLEALATPYLDQPVGPAEIESLRLQMTRLYVDRGYINSGLLLKRVSPDDGLVEFDVVEGRLSGIRLHGMERLKDDYVTGALQRSGDGPLNVDRLRERFQLLLGDPLFEHLNARLLPGSAPGEAVLDVDVTRARPYQITVFANNYRPVSVGSNAMGISGWVRNLTGYGDLLEASVQGPTDGGGDLRGGFAWRVPLGHAGTSLSLAVDEGNSSVVEESVRSLDITSRLTSREIGLAQTLSETLTRKLSIGVQAVQRENRTWLLGSPFSFNPGEPDGEVRERLWRFWQELVLRSESQVLALRSTFTWGHNNLETIAGLPPVNQPPSNYRLWLGQAQFARQLAGNGAQFIARATVQRSPDRLLALDGVAIGGVNTVRGYRENQLVRDEGHVLNLELEWPLLRDEERGLRLVGVPFYDHGRGKNHGESATTLQSVGLALRLAWRGFNAELAWARRLDQPAATRDQGDSLQDRGVHLQVSYRF